MTTNADRKSGANYRQPVEPNDKKLADLWYRYNAGEFSIFDGEKYGGHSGEEAIAGYVCGGYAPSSGLTRIDKLTFSNDTLYGVPAIADSASTSLTIRTKTSTDSTDYFFNIYPIIIIP